MFRKPKSPRAETSESHLVFWLALGCEEHFPGLGCGCEGHFVSFFSTDASFVKGPSPPGPLGGRDLGVRGPGLRAAGRRRRRVPADHPGEAQGRAEARGGVGGTIRLEHWTTKSVGVGRRWWLLGWTVRAPIGSEVVGSEVW